ncbi:MAG: hypothetical protein AAFO04_29190 [Cyanobacteria bacterium J06592_8]
MIVLTPEDNQIQIISKSEDGDSVSLEELANTHIHTDSQPSSDAEILLGVSEENKHPVRKESPPDVTKNPVLKTLFQVGLLGVVVLLASLMWMVFGGTGKSPEPIALTNEEVDDEQAQKIRELEDALYRERAQVAVRNLQSPLPNEAQAKKKSTPQPQTQAKTKPEKPTPKPTTTTVTRPSPPPPARRVSSPPPMTRTLPVQVARRSPNRSPVQSLPPSPPVSQPSPSPTTPKEEFDDLSLWGELAV